MIKKVIILGTGGHSIDILDIINDINRRNQEYECVGFLDDDPDKYNKTITGIKIIGRLENAGQYPDCFFVNGIGNSLNFYKKNEIIKKTGVNDDRFITLIHPTASVSDMSKIKHGTVIFPNVTINSNVKIGCHVIVLSNTVISHDCRIGNFTSIAGGVCISGNATIGTFCYIGSNASIKENIEVKKYSLIGIGSTVIDNVKQRSVVVGNPAKTLKMLKVD